MAKSGTAKPKVFIDGEAGTTGLQIRDRLAALPAVEVISIAPAERKNPAARTEMYRKAVVVILCLPDAAAKEALALVQSLGKDAPRIIDASTAHRTAPGWTFGFPELGPDQGAAVAKARLVTNPGCYSTGAIALLRPLIDAGLLPADYPISINAVSGYTGGGNSMIAAYEVEKTAPPFELYGLSLAHKHIPEIEKYAGLTRRPIFVPSVGNFPCGMLVSIPLHLDSLPESPSAAVLEAALSKHYRGFDRVEVVPAPHKADRLSADALAGSDKLQIFVYGDDKRHQAVLVARLDNLGKGAAGAAVQNLLLMLGL